MPNITEEKHIEMLEKKADGSYIAKYPKVKSKSGVTFDEHLAGIATENQLGHIKFEDVSLWQKIDGGAIKPMATKVNLNLPQGFEDFRIIIRRLVANANKVDLNIRFDDSTSAYDYNKISSSAISRVRGGSITLTGAMFNSNTSSSGINIYIQRLKHDDRPLYDVKNFYIESIPKYSNSPIESYLGYYSGSSNVDTINFISTTQSVISVFDYEMWGR